jgi:hypothetical protein
MGPNRAPATEKGPLLWAFFMYANSRHRGSGGARVAAVCAAPALPQAASNTAVLTIPAGLPVSPQAHRDIEACIGEDVVITGYALLVIHRTLLPTGDTEFVVHANPQGASATGVITGDVYTFAASDTRSRFTGSPLSTFTSTGTFNVISRGGGPSWLVHFRVLFTINAQGELTADVEIFAGSCS